MTDRSTFNINYYHSSDIMFCSTIIKCKQAITEPEKKG